MNIPRIKLPATVTASPRRRFLAGAAAFVVVVAAVSAVFALHPGSGDKHLTAYFPSANGLYTGDRVQVLGVPVGTVTSVTPQRGRVKVEMTYSSKVKVPAGAKAAVVTPTLVTTRTVQLTPAYHGSGPVLADGAVIPEPRTAVPIEWDQVEKELNTLATSLGPKSGANGKVTSGALKNALNTAAANLKGNGQDMHDTLSSLSAASQTLSDNRGNLFGTLDNLQQFISVLQQSNGQVGDFEQQLASVSGVLNDNKQGIAQTLASLHGSLGTVTTFVANNRNALESNLSTANSVTANLARSDQTLANILQIAPTVIANADNIYNPIDHSITGALAPNGVTQNPAEFICSTIFDLGGTGPDCQQALAPLVNIAKMSNAPVGVDPFNRGGFNGDTKPASGAPAAGTNSSSSSQGLLGLLGGGGRS